MTPFERQLDSAIAVHSSELVPCNAYVRFLLDVLQQQPFSPAYDMHPSPDTVSVRDQLLELPSAHQTNVLVRILQVYTASCTEKLFRSAAAIGRGNILRQHCVKPSRADTQDRSERVQQSTSVAKSRPCCHCGAHEARSDTASDSGVLKGAIELLFRAGQRHASH